MSQFESKPLPLPSFAPMPNTRPPELIHTFPEGEKVVAMTVFKDRVVVATTWNVYWVIDNKLHRIEMVDEPQKEPS